MFSATCSVRRRRCGGEIAEREFSSSVGPINFVGRMSGPRGEFVADVFQIWGMVWMVWNFHGGLADQNEGRRDLNALRFVRQED